MTLSESLLPFSQLSTYVRSSLIASFSRDISLDWNDPRVVVVVLWMI